MVSILKKELASFFGSLIGYMAIIVFLLISGFFMWISPDSNMLDFGYASMDKFFQFAPWVLLFLIPAITMRTFSDEFRAGTIETLFTLPIKIKNIILGKYFANLIIIFFAIIPTFLYVLTLSNLSVIENNLDTGGIIGSYLGLFLLCGAFNAIGIFSSTLSSNQIVSFIVAVLLNFILFAGFETISHFKIFENGIDYILSQIGMQFHYNSISRGVMDTRDIIYFLGVMAVGISGAQLILNNRKRG